MLLDVVDRYAPLVCDRPLKEEKMLRGYGSRLWTCLAHHAPLPVAGAADSLEALVALAEGGKLITGDRKENLLLDVMTAHAMELHHQKAALRFDREYLPRVVALARRTGGESAVEAVENFGAELIMPRESGRSRITEYQGRTTLIGWLRTVVARFVVSRSRKKRALSGVEMPEACSRETNDHGDARDCEPLLRPMFAEVTKAVAADQRLLLKLLLVDEVPQFEVAESLQIASGNVTRRRQKAVADALAQLNILAAERNAERRVAECLDAILTAGDQELRTRLGAVLAAGLKHEPRPVMEDKPR